MNVSRMLLVAALFFLNVACNEVMDEEDRPPGRCAKSQSMSTCSSQCAYLFYYRPLQGVIFRNWQVVKSTNGGLDWEDSDLFSYNADSTSNWAQVIGENSRGELFVGGSAGDGSGNFDFVLRKSDDQGVSWHTVSRARVPRLRSMRADNPGRSEPTSISFDSNDGIYVTVQLTEGISVNVDMNFTWVVLRSLDNGMTWETIDVQENLDFGCPTAEASINDSTVDSQNRLIAVGGIQGLSKKSGWYVRRYANGVGETLDFYEGGPPAEGGGATAVTVAPNGDIFVAGGIREFGIWSSLIRRSRDNGATWETVDKFSMADARNQHYESIKAVGNTIVVRGITSFNRCDAFGTEIWTFTAFTRKSFDGGATWTTTDTRETPGLHDVTQTFYPRGYRDSGKYFHVTGNGIQFAVGMKETGQTVQCLW